MTIEADLRRQVREVLADASLDSEDDPRNTSRGEELCKLAEFNAQIVESEMLEILARSESESNWNVAAAFFWGQALERKILNGDRAIAYLCLRFSPSDNLVWSIITKLKGVDYLSSYDPRQDQGVLLYLRPLEDVRAGADASPDALTKP